MLLALVLVQVACLEPRGVQPADPPSRGHLHPGRRSLRWAFGSAGILAFVLLLLLQAAALGNVLPIETAPAPLPLLNRVLPLTSYVNAHQSARRGRLGGLVCRVVTVLLVWGVGSSGVALMLVRRRRVSPAPAAVAA